MARSPSPPSLLAPLLHQICNRVPLFDQIIVNLYRPGDGIMPHVDLLRFEVTSACCCESWGAPVRAVVSHGRGQRMLL